MKKLILLFLIIIPNLLLSKNLHLSDEEKNYLLKNDLEILITRDFYPFSFYNEKNELIGFSVDYINLLSKILDKDIKLVTGNWSQNLKKFKENKYKLIDQISYKKERESFTNYTKTYYEIPNVIFSLEDKFNNYKNMYDLQDKKIGITKDIYYFKDIKNLGIFNLVIFENSKDKMKALAYGKIDACINNLISAQEYIKSGGYSNIKVLEEVDENIIKREDLRIGVNKNELILFSIINKASELVSKNELNNIYHKWFGLGEINTKTQNLNLDEDEISYLKNTNSLTVCTYDNQMPISDIDINKPDGIINSYTNLISSKLNIDFTFDKLNSTHKCDLTLTADKTSQNIFNYINLFDTPIVISTNDKIEYIHDISLLKGKKVVILKNTFLKKYLEDKIKNISIIEVNTPLEALNLVDMKKVFAYIGDSYTSNYYIQKYYFGKIFINGTLNQKLKFYFEINKDDNILANLIKKTIDETNSIEKEKILNKWINIQYNNIYDYSLIWKIVLVLSLILFILITRHRYIKKQNDKLKSLYDKLKIENQERIETQKKLQEAIGKLDNLAKIDQLTNLFNRRELDNIIINLCNEKNTHNKDFSVIIFDVDYFKLYNDTYGHLNGDKCLKHIANILFEEVDQSSKFAARYGGEEFVIILTNSTKDDALNAANIIKDKLLKTKFIHEKSKVSQYLTLSAGIANSSELINCNYEDIMKLADNRLYKSKINGRDKITFE